MNGKILWTKESELPNAPYVDLFKEVRFTGFYREATVEKAKHAPKHNDLAVQYRQDGNAAFERNDLKKAMEFYNKSLCFTEPESEQAGLAYANRSYCFLNLRMFQKCLVDIELAKKANYPEELLPKLEKRKLECSKHVKTAATHRTMPKPKMSFPSDEEVPSMVNAIKIERNSEFGRHIVAQCDIAEDKVVLIEEPMFKLLNALEYRKCLVCLQENENLIPCTNCTSAMFCAGACSENDFHRYECSMKRLHYFEASDGGKRVRNGVRFVMQSVIKILSQFPSDAEMIQFVEECVEDMRKDPHGIAVSDGSPKSNFKSFMKLHHLNKFTAKSGDDQTFALYAVNACIAYEMLMNHTDFAEHFTTTSGQRFLMHLSTQLLANFKANNVQLREFESGDLATMLATDGFIDFGVAVFNIGCYFNHSCLPNVINVTNSKYSVAKTVRPIKKGDQLCVHYCVSSLQPTKERRAVLLESMEFFCKCELCLENGPTKNRNPALDSAYRVLASQTAPLLFKKCIAPKELEKIKRKCYEFLAKFRNEPASEPMIMAYEHLKMIYVNEMQNV